MKIPLKDLHKALLLLRKIPKGKIVSYKELARASGTSPRAVGQILRRNPRSDVCPCYKVIKTDGSLGGYSGQTQSKQMKKKIGLLKKDGIIVKNGKISKEYFWYF